jgi:hypothetical protein
MLLIFSLSITPKLFLHDLVAHHKDLSYPSHQHTDQINTAGFHCDRESQVVELPYISHVICIHLIVPGSFHTYQTRADHQVYFLPHFIVGLRGPPTRV